MARSGEEIDWAAYADVMESRSSRRHAAPLHDFYVWLARVLRAAVPRPQRLMDVGCGTGSLSRKLRRSFPRAKLELSDRNEVMVGRTRARFRDDPLARVRRAPAESILSGTATASVDGIIFCRSWYALGNHEDVAHHVTRVLKPGGYCFLFDFCRRPTRAEIDAAFGAKDSDEGRISRTAVTAFNTAVRNGTYRLHSDRSLRRLWSRAGAVVQHRDVLKGGAHQRVGVRRPVGGSPQ